jgi:methylase of polypeptide subunit release factors
MRRIHLRSIGDVYLPERFSEVILGSISPKLFGPKDLDQLNRIFNHLRRGGIAVVSGQWSKILEVFSYLEKKKREFSSGMHRDLLLKDKAERREPTYRKRTKHWYERHYQIVLSRVMVIANDNELPYIDPPVHIPYLLELLGESPGSNNGLPFLVPVLAIQKVQSDMKQSYYISALDADIIAHSNVLQPLSQDTIELFQEGLENVRQTASVFREGDTTIEILDMGCGCGCLSLLAAKVFADYDVRILATDILPEAIATTKLNVQHFMEAGEIETTDSGDLFDPVGDRRFDLIIFNAPWVVSEPQSRAEMATHDAEQETVRRFLMESPDYLKEGGHIILGYSDHSGPTTLKSLESFIEDAGFKVEKISKRRTQSRRQKRKWETILVYDLMFL